MFFEKGQFRLCFHPNLTENYVKSNIVSNRVCPHKNVSSQQNRQEKTWPAWHLDRF